MDWIKVFEISVPILLALIGLIPTIISNRKKTQQSISDMMEEIKKDTKQTNDKVDSVAAQLQIHITESEEEKARQARMRILRFYDELCAGDEHSESYFEDILDDCKFYELYCTNHKEFQNHRGQAAIEYIDATYRKIKQNGGFLQHK
jgi:hypothetical protein